MKIALIDDDVAVLESLSQFLTAAGLDSAPFSSAEAFLANGLDKDIGCVVSDVRLPNMTGIELHREIARRSPGLPVILITGQGDIAMAVAAVQAGAFDFIEKPFTDDRIITSVRNAIAAGARNRADADLRAEFTGRIAELSPRQKQVMDLLVVGLSNKEIALRLGLSTRTVENYRAWVMERMRTRNLAELVRLATWLEGREIEFHGTAR
ncbi:response regulator transcription factor [Hyphomicrobium sp.]|uniref:response regulator transcription factor n=1 Tax=Hyphomicrobium sp. TaxID=82 RepID=UPI002D7926F2|nr:response regulator [Hyphomicrobium sp.]HET6389596.1 response regulator [Hyphomicrobium sp.]